MDLCRRQVFRLLCMALNPLLTGYVAPIVYQKNGEVGGRCCGKMSMLQGRTLTETHREMEPVFVKLPIFHMLQ